MKRKKSKMNDWNKGAKEQSHVIEMTFFSY